MFIFIIFPQNICLLSCSFLQRRTFFRVSKAIQTAGVYGLSGINRDCHKPAGEWLTADKTRAGSLSPTNPPAHTPVSFTQWFLGLITQGSANSPAKVGPIRLALSVRFTQEWDGQVPRINEAHAPLQHVSVSMTWLPDGLQCTVPFELRDVSDTLINWHSEHQRRRREMADEQKKGPVSTVSGVYTQK